MNSMFEKMAEYYDLIMGPFDYRELADCLDDIIISCEGKRTDILDIGCGTSEELIYFSQLGYEVSGIDISKEMIAISKKKIPHGFFSQADMRNFGTDKKYDNVISTIDTVNYITDPDELKECFRSVNRSMNIKGLFLFDFNTKEGLVNCWEGVNIEDTENFFICYDSDFDPDSLILECRMKIIIKNSDDRIKEFEQTHYERAYSLDEIRIMLTKSGFNTETVLPFLSREKTDEKGLERYQIAARKINEIKGDA